VVVVRGRRGMVNFYNILNYCRSKNLANNKQFYGKKV
jgi:hypothetical protein